MKILDKYIELIEEGYCSDCNELNCIDNFPHKKIAQEIKQLQQENQQLKKQKDDVVEYIKYQLSNLDFKKDEDMKAKMLGSMILVMLEDKRMLGEIDEQ